METNFQHYEKEILEIIKQNDFLAVVNNVPTKCKGTGCEKCELPKLGGGNCNANRILWGYKKYALPANLTRLEYELLEYYFEKGYQYIARDKDDACVCVFDEFPTKDEIEWSIAGMGFKKVPFNDLFKFIWWEEEEPRDIEHMLNNYEVNENVG